MTSLVFSPDGRLLASAGADAAILIWDTKTDALLHRLEGHRDVVTSINFSADGKWLASASRDGSIDIWDTSTWQIAEVCHDPYADYYISFLPDANDFVTWSYDRINTWQRGTDAPIKTCHSNERLSAVCALHDGEVITGSEKGTLTVWDPIGGVKTAEFHHPRTGRGRQNAVFGIAEEPDGNVLVSDVSGIWRWDRTSNKFQWIAKGVYGVSTPLQNGKYLLGGNNRQVWVREADPSGVAVIFRLGFEVHAVAASPTGDVWAYAGRGRWNSYYVWQTGGDAEIRLMKTSDLPAAMTIQRKEDTRLQKQALAKNPNAPLDRIDVSPDEPQPRPWQAVAVPKPPP